MSSQFSSSWVTLFSIVPSVLSMLRMCFNRSCLILLTKIHIQVRKTHNIIKMKVSNPCWLFMNRLYKVWKMRPIPPIRKLLVQKVKSSITPIPQQSCQGMRRKLTWPRIPMMTMQLQVNTVIPARISARCLYSFEGLNQ